GWPTVRRDREEPGTVPRLPGRGGGQPALEAGPGSAVEPTAGGRRPARRGARARLQPGDPHLPDACRRRARRGPLPAKPGVGLPLSGRSCAAGRGVVWLGGTRRAIWAPRVAAPAKGLESRG